MTGVSLTFARIKEVLTVGDGTYYRIAVKTDSAEVDMGLVQRPDGGFVNGDGLIFGAMIGTHGGEKRFVPLRAGGGLGSGGNNPGTGGGAEPLLPAIVTDRTAGPDQWTWVYDFVEADGTGPPMTWAPKADGVTGVFRSTLEGVLGDQLQTGILLENLEPATPGDSFEPVPLAIGARVILGRAKQYWYVLSTTPAVDGRCPDTEARARGS